MQSESKQIAADPRFRSEFLFLCVTQNAIKGDTVIVIKGMRKILKVSWPGTSGNLGRHSSRWPEENQSAVTVNLPA